MNTRLQTRLAEWEVLKIISDTTEAVACMHYLRPPLLHRDLKIENVLISGNGDYKLCDFGSCTEPRSAAATSQERRALEDDIQKNTTIQYRSPEMVDVGRRLPIDEKSDIWALGVLLYKLCYFTTPFEAQGQLAILNAAYTFPPYPPYTDRTKRLIAVTLQENPRDRPNIYQLLAELCAMRNLPVPIPDIYSKKRDQSVGKSSRSSSRPPSAPNNEDILTYEAAAAAAPKTPIIPTADVVPMRRGRPERTTSPTRLDLKSQTHHRSSSRPNTAGEGIVGDVAEFTTKFPSLEEMDQSLQSTSIPRDQGIGKRRPDELESSGPPAQALSPADLGLSHPGRATGSGARPLPQTPDLQTNSSADVADRPIRGLAVDDPSSGLEGAQARIAQGPRSEAYVLRNTDYQANNDSRIPPTGPAPAVRPKPVFPDVGRPIQPNQNASNPYTTSKPDNLFAERLQARPQMVSRASQTSPKPKQAVQTQTSPPKRTNANHNFSTDSSLSSNLTRDSSGLVIPKAAFSKGQANASGVTQQMQFKFSTTLDRPNQRMKAQQEIERSKSATGGRPKTIHVDSSMDFLRDIDSPMTSVTHSDSLEASRTGSSQVSDSSRRQINSAPRTTNAEPRLPPITSDLRRSVSVSASNRRHHKRPSISTIPSFSGAAKNIMNGKFGDAFKKFEVSGKPRGTTSAIERSNPLQVAENDLPGNLSQRIFVSRALLISLEHITQHLQSAEARRSSSYSRARPSMESQVIDNESYRNHTEQSVNIESSSTSVKEAMRRLKEKVSCPVPVIVDLY